MQTCMLEQTKLARVLRKKRIEPHQEKLLSVAISTNSAEM